MRIVWCGCDKFPTGTANAISVPKFVAWKDNTQAFEFICAYNFSAQGMNLSGGAVPEQVKGVHVSADFFPVFEAEPLAGRVFSTSEDIPGGPKLAVMSHGLWARRFAGDLSVIGRTMTLDGELYTVTGILRPGFRSYPDADLYLPLQLDRNTTNQGNYLSVAARLKPGVSLDTANAQLKIAAKRFSEANPKAAGKEESAGAFPFQETMVGDVKQPLLILLGAVALVLLIACANVANLLLIRGTGRKTELAVRMAIGAGRGRLIQQLLTESIVLAVAGGAAGLAIGTWGAHVLIAMSPANLPRAAELAGSGLLDGRLLAFTMGIVLVTGVLFGFVPAWQISRTDVNSILKESSSRSGTGRRHFARNVLVVAETALALVLLIGAALLIRTFASLHKVDAGFNPSHVLSFETTLGGSKYATTASVDLLTRNVVREIETLPGVTTAANVPFLPLEGGFSLGFDIPGRTPPPGQASTGGGAWTYVSPEYFKVLEIPLRRGRFFTERDTASSPKVAIVNEAFAKKYWPDGDALGQRIQIGVLMGPDFAEGPREIAGVIGDVKEWGIGKPAPPMMYVPLAQVRDSFIALDNTFLPMTWIVKTSAAPLSMIAAVRKKVAEADGQLAIGHERSVDQAVEEGTARQNFNMTLLSVFAGMALLLAAIGIYGMVSYSVEQRSQEIGIRMALGARSGDVRGMVIRQGMALAGLGIAIGLAAGLGLSRLLTAQLYGVKANDPVTFTLIGTMLAGIALAACWIPAARATRVDPVTALRHQ